MFFWNSLAFSMIQRRPGQSSLSARALRYGAWAQSWSSAALAARSVLPSNRPATPLFSPACWVKAVASLLGILSPSLIACSERVTSFHTVRTRTATMRPTLKETEANINTQQSCETWYNHVDEFRCQFVRSSGPLRCLQRWLTA